jgi:surfeit locus 1 family protein
MRQRLVLPAAFTVVGLVILVSLGVWQLERLRWKEALIATVATRLASAPIAAPDPSDWPGIDPDALDYQPVTVTGRFLNDLELYVYASVMEPKGPYGGVGYRVMTPLQTPDGWIVMVNRGFVPADRRDPATRPEGQLEGVVTVKGLMRPPEARGMFTPDNDAEHNIWFTRDPREMAFAIGINPIEVAPYSIDAAYDPNLPGGLPQGGETVISFPNNHLAYALTWFGLAIALLGVFIAYVRSRAKAAGPAGDAAPPGPQG